MCRWKTYGEDISHLIKCGNELDKDVTVEYLLTNKVVIHFNVLCASLKDWLETKTKALTLSHQRTGGVGRKILSSLNNI
jgi:hypothetical protein